jgi:hypothetical protein
VAARQSGRRRQPLLDTRAAPVVADEADGDVAAQAVVPVYVRVHACVSVCVRVRVRACMRACVCMCIRRHRQQQQVLLLLLLLLRPATRTHAHGLAEEPADGGEIIEGAAVGDRDVTGEGPRLLDGGQVLQRRRRRSLLPHGEEPDVRVPVCQVRGGRKRV